MPWKTRYLFLYPTNLLPVQIAWAVSLFSEVLNQVEINQKADEVFLVKIITVLICGAVMSCKNLNFLQNCCTGGQLPIHSLKWNPNDVLTTCKAICEVLVSGYASCACADVAYSNGNRTLKGKIYMAAKGGGFGFVLSFSPFNWSYFTLLSCFRAFCFLWKHKFTRGVFYSQSRTVALWSIESALIDSVEFLSWVKNWDRVQSTELWNDQIIENKSRILCVGTVSIRS